MNLQVHKENLIQVEDGPHNESDEKDKSEDDSSPKEVNDTGQHVNTASPEVNAGRFKLNIVDPLVNTASSYDPDSPKYMFKLGASHTLEATHVEFFSDEDELEVNLGNITNSYTVPTTPNTRIHKDHPIKNVIKDVKSSIKTRRITKSTSEQGLNPQALLKLYPIHLGWKPREELLQFKLQQVWKLVDLPNRKKAIRTKWVFRNKKDERGIVIRNKARLVAQGHRQEEGIDYEEVFVPVARIEAIRLFLAYASVMGFLVYQIDAKSAFLYGTIEEEVYVTQPPGFKDPDHPDKLYKVVKALYGLYQAPRAWYETMDNYLLGSGFKRGKIDQTLFIKKQKRDILLKFNYTDVKSASTPVDLEKPLVKDGDADDVDVGDNEQYLGTVYWRERGVYVCLFEGAGERFVELAKQALQGSAFLYGTIEEEVYVTQPPGFKDPDHPDKVYKVVKALYGLHQAPRACKKKIFCLYKSMLMTLSLALQTRSYVTQKEDGIFISQDKYVAEILKKFNYIDVKSASTPVDLEKPLVKDRDVDDVDVHLYRSMIGSLMYLIASRPDIMFEVCACARFQVTPKTSHLLAIKRIFRYLKGKPTLGLWYSRDSPFELVAYTDSDYAGATQDMKSTT
ncbi:putative ribonuclease H-like domain-containing protein, partial [Tanacetum coccineum]